MGFLQGTSVGIQKPCRDCKGYGRKRRYLNADIEKLPGSLISQICGDLIITPKPLEWCLQKYWKRIRTTNIMERIDKELKRRSKVVGAFPNDELLLGLVVSILIDINEEWITGNRNLFMKD